MRRLIVLLSLATLCVASSSTPGLALDADGRIVASPAGRLDMISYENHGDRERVVVAEIGRARRFIMLRLENDIFPSVKQALALALKRGVRLWAICCEPSMSRRGETREDCLAAFLKRTGARVYVTCAAFGGNTLLIDGETVVAGSFVASHARTEKPGDILVLRSRSLARLYAGFWRDDIKDAKEF